MRCADRRTTAASRWSPRRSWVAPPSGGRRPRALVGVLLILGLVTGAVASAAASSRQPRRATPLQQGLAFYRGQSLTFVTGSPGGGTDLTARALAPLVASYLHATVNVLDEGQANGVPGQDALAAATPNGLTFGYVNAGSIASEVFTSTPGFNFNPGRLSWIVGNYGASVLLVSTPTSPYPTFAAFKSASSIAPVKVLAEVPSQGTSGLEILLGILAIPVQLVTGYSTTSAVALGFERGDGPTASLSYPNAESLLQGGQARPIAISSLPPPGTTDRQYVLSAPTYAELLKQYLAKSPSRKVQTEISVLEKFIGIGQPIVTQAKVSGDKLIALRAAFAWAYKQPSFISGAFAAGSNPEYLDPVRAKAAYNSMIAGGAAVAGFLRSV